MLTVGFISEGGPYPGGSGCLFVTWSLINYLIKHGCSVRLCVLLPKSEVDRWEANERRHMEVLRHICSDVVLIGFESVVSSKSKLLDKIISLPIYLSGYSQFYPHESVKKNIVDFIEKDKPDVIYIFDTGPMIAMSDYKEVPRMVVPGDPLFEVLKYRISSLTLKERFQPNNILRWLRYLFMHRKLERLVINKLRNYEWVGIYGDQHAKWLVQNGIDCNSLPIPVMAPKRRRILSAAPLHRTDKPVSILIFGRQNSTAGLTGVKLLVQEILPILRKSVGKDRYQIHIAGAGGLPVAFEKEIRKANCVIHGEVEDMADVFINSDIFLETSTYPVGVRTRIVTALSFGMCVVACSQSKMGISKLVNGENCLLGDTGCQIVDNLLRCVKDANLREKLSANALKTYEATFDPEVAGKIVLREMKRLISVV